MSEWNRRVVRCDSNDNSTELSIEVSGTEMDPYNLFSDNLSPIPSTIVPRKLDFSGLDDEADMKDAAPAPEPLSPPYKRVRALR